MKASEKKTAENYSPERLEKWTRPPCYIGEHWPEYYVFLSRNRDSDTLTNCNFHCALNRLGGEDGDLVVVVREGHWACGWIEWIAVHQDAGDKLKAADSILESLEGYPVLDEDALSEAESREADENWESWQRGEILSDCVSLLEDWAPRCASMLEHDKNPEAFDEWFHGWLDWQGDLYCYEGGTSYYWDKARIERDDMARLCRMVK